MNVAFVAGIDPFAPRPSGIRTHILGLAEAMARRGHRVAIFGAGPERTRGSRSWSFNSVVPQSAPSSFRFLSRLFLQAPRLPVDGSVVHAHRADDLAALALRRGVKARVLTLHGMTSLGVRQRHGPAAEIAYRMAEQVGVRSADRIITLDGRTRLELEGLFPTLRDRIVPGSGGVDLERFFLRSRRECRLELEIEDVPTVAFVGRLAPEKNIPLLMRALSEAWQFIVAGDGPLRPDLEAFGRERRTLRYLGTLAPDRVATVLNAADVLALPSAREAMPSVCLEALACGTPVVGTRVGGLVDIIADGENGFLVEPNEEAISGALASAIDRSEAMRSACRASVSPFGWAAVAEATERIYEGVT